jgi:hypothetical protein
MPDSDCRSEPLRRAARGPSGADEVWTLSSQPAGLVQSGLEGVAMGLRVRESTVERTARSRSRLLEPSRVEPAIERCVRRW